MFSFRQLSICGMAKTWGRVYLTHLDWTIIVSEFINHGAEGGETYSHGVGTFLCY